MRSLPLPTVCSCSVTWPWGRSTVHWACQRDYTATKVLLAGNHDRCAVLHGRKAVGWDERYRREGGFAEIHQGAMRIDLDARHRKVLACHFPYRGDSTDVLRYAAERPVDTGEWLVHGHVHESWLQSGRQINVSIDAWGGRVANAEEVVALMKSGPRDLPRIEWSD